MGLIRHNRRRDTWEDTDKTQLHLGLGSDGYAAYRLDQAGLEAEDFVADDRVIDANDERTPDDVQHVPEEPEHVANFAKILGDAAEAQRRLTMETQKFKKRNQANKIRAFPGLKKEAVREALKTEDKTDDRIAARMNVRDVSDMILDDGITGREYEEDVMDFYFGDL